MNLNTLPALVLNADYRPISYFPLSLWHWEDAIKAVVKETVDVVAEYDVEVRSPSTTMKLPSVVALREYYAAPKHVAFTRFNVFLRDRFKCQYCGESYKPNDLTFDHVLPRSRGGKTEWKNIVAACHDCNTRKDDSILRPIRLPKEPTHFELLEAQRSFPPKYLHESWLDHLFWDTELET